MVQNKNFENYVYFTGAEIRHFTEKSLEAVKHDKQQLPDVLFIDHKYRQREGELDQFLNIDTRVVVITTGDQKRMLKHYGKRIDKILYKPVNLSKTIRVLSNEREEKVHKESYHFRNVHILVADDNTINQKLITNILNKIGIEVTLSNNGQEALDERVSNPDRYDMIFMDIEMPVMGGMEATARILGYERKHELSHIPIIALTANALASDRTKYLGAGMDGFLAKPLELDALNKVLETYFIERAIYV